MQSMEHPDREEDDVMPNAPQGFRHCCTIC
jgi:hypothetical protein